MVFNPESQVIFLFKLVNHHFSKYKFFQRTALHWAASHGNLEHVKMLIKQVWFSDHFEAIFFNLIAIKNTHACWKSKTSIWNTGKKKEKGKGGWELGVRGASEGGVAGIRRLRGRG